MKLIHTIDEVRQNVSKAKSENKTIGLVPTMGALHKGHLTLVEHAKAKCDFVIVSVFVNPTQFGPAEDFNKYPRTLDADAEKCRAAGVGIVFAPSANEMYPDGFDSWIEVNGVTKMLEGGRRPIHFRGVATVCTKLFNITRADFAFFGQKDYQQLKVIQKMVRDLNMPLEICPVEIVREEDGLARSSRNSYMNVNERKASLILHKSLEKAKADFDSGVRCIKQIQADVESVIKSEPLAQIDYVSIVDAERLTPAENMNCPVVVLLAVKIGATRLIDNIILS